MTVPHSYTLVCDPCKAHYIFYCGRTLVCLDLPPSLVGDPGFYRSLFHGQELGAFYVSARSVVIGHGVPEGCIFSIYSRLLA